MSRPRMCPNLRYGWAALLLLGLGGCDSDRLRLIVQQQCLPHWQQTHDPAPCLSLHVDAQDGYALLADRKGGAHFLLIPLNTVSGIESPALRAPGAPNYFAAAWNARALLAPALGHAPARAEVGLAVNSITTRSQNQLHIHIACVRADIAAALHALAPRLSLHWQVFDIAARRFEVLRLAVPALTDNPFALLATLPQARERMGAYTLLLVGMQDSDGAGFALLAAQGRPGGESLLDARCAIG